MGPNFKLKTGKKNMPHGTITDYEMCIYAKKGDSIQFYVIFFS